MCVCVKLSLVLYFWQKQTMQKHIECSVLGSVRHANTAISWGTEQRPNLIAHFLYHTLGQPPWPRLHYLLIFRDIMSLKSYLENSEM